MPRPKKRMPKSLRPAQHENSHRSTSSRSARVAENSTQFYHWKRLIFREWAEILPRSSGADYPFKAAAFCKVAEWNRRDWKVAPGCLNLCCLWPECRSRWSRMTKAAEWKGDSGDSESKFAENWSNFQKSVEPCCIECSELRMARSLGLLLQGEILPK